MQALIRKVLTDAKLKAEYVDKLAERTDLYEIAFTAKSFDPERNYEIFEFLGDSSVNKFLAWYFARRFPQLNCPQGLKYLARLKINYASQRTFAEIATKLGFLPFIRYSKLAKDVDQRALLEDVFEAFIGVTEYLIDEIFVPGVGFAVVYDLLASIFDGMEVSLKYEDVFDAKSRLKELADANPAMGALIYENTDKTTTTLYNRMPNGVKRKIGVGHGAHKNDRERDASEQGLKVLEAEGFKRKANFAVFCA